MQQNRPLKTGSVCCYLPSRTTNFRKLQANQVLTDRRFLRWLAGFQGDTEWISWPNRHNNRPSLAQLLVPHTEAKFAVWFTRFFKEKSYVMASWSNSEGKKRSRLSTTHDDLYSWFAAERRLGFLQPIDTNSNSNCVFRLKSTQKTEWLQFNGFLQELV